ncbi:MAG: translocation protein TolB, partial [Gemmatimonadota bacterium]
APLTFQGGSQPSWSPDARRISFQRSVDGVFQIFTMNADGTDVVQVTFEGGINAAWSSRRNPK